MSGGPQPYNSPSGESCGAWDFGHALSPARHQPRERGPVMTQAERFFFQWDDKSGARKGAVGYGATKQDAHARAIEIARSQGYEPPKWWQFLLPASRAS